MGHAVRGDIAVGSAANGWTACLYHLYYTLNTWLPGEYDNRIEIIDSYAGSGGTWADETTVTDDAFIVIEMQDIWDDATKWQAVFTARDANLASTIGTTVGAIAIPGRGLWCMMSPKGGWDNTARTFGGAVTTTLRHILGKTSDAAGVAVTADTVMNVGFADRVDSDGLIDNGILFVHLKVSGAYGGSFLVGAFTPFDEDRGYPVMLLAGTPNPADLSNYYGYQMAGSSAGSLCAADGLSIVAAVCDPAVNLDGKLLDEVGGYVGYPLLFFNSTLGRAVGWFDGITRIDNAVPSGSTFDSGLKWANARLAWPWGVDVPIA